MLVTKELKIANNRAIINSVNMVAKHAYNMLQHASKYASTWLDDMLITWDMISDSHIGRFYDVGN